MHRKCLLKITELASKADLNRMNDIFDPETDDFAIDYSGGNFDDAYQMGIEDGRAELALELHELLEKME